MIKAFDFVVSMEANISNNGWMEQGQMQSSVLFKGVWGTGQAEKQISTLKL
jgi:hypothetical protein